MLADGDSYLHGVNDKLGYWEKTSSVNFCERDFEFNPYVAEFHNTWSSLIIILLPLWGSGTVILRRSFASRSLTSF